MKSLERLSSIDAMRGLMMIIMAIDHTRDHFTNVPFDPTDPSKTNLLLYFTRWVSNFCAPVFVLLVGVSMYLALKAGKTKKQLSWFLFTRGLWLILAELIIMHFAWTFTFDLRAIEFNVLSVTGAGMIFLSALLYLPPLMTFILSVSVIALHNLLDGKDVALLGKFSPLHLAENPFTVNLFQTNITFYPLYVLIPWIIVPALGFSIGKIFTLDPAKRSKILMITGTVCLALFAIIRGINAYGDLVPWTSHATGMQTALSFLNITKYPPSLLYLLLNYGIACFLFVLIENAKGRLTKILATFGQVPFAFYVLHVIVIHAIALALGYIRFGSAAADKMINNELFSLNQQLGPMGYDLPMVYLVWLVVLFLFYPFCKWYGSFKKRHKKNALLSYL